MELDERIPSGRGPWQSVLIRNSVHVQALGRRPHGPFSAGRFATISVTTAGKGQGVTYMTQDDRSPLRVFPRPSCMTESSI